MALTTLNPSPIRNYSPVCLFSFLSKTLEHRVYNQLSSYLSQNDLLDHNQFGFRIVYSAEMALLTMTESLVVA